MSIEVGQMERLGGLRLWAIHAWSAASVVSACAERPAEPVAPAQGPARSTGDAARRVHEPEVHDPEVHEPEQARSIVPIAARSQAADSPPSGWCGETAIQEALLHLGVWAPQRAINTAGKPAHPDLYSPDIPVALTALGVRYTSYPARRRGYDAFARWVRAALDDGRPVLAGVKILPTAHPEWGLDHFVLVVGHGDRGLLVNTTWGHRQWVTGEATNGLSFVNAFYGIRIDGVRLASGATPARLEVIEEGADTVKLRIVCVEPGQRAIERRDDRGSVAEVGDETVVDARRSWRFSCAPRRD